MTTATRYRILPDLLHVTLAMAGVGLTGLLFALVAPRATTIMMAIMSVFFVAAWWPARLVVGCDGFATTWLGLTLYVPFGNILRLERKLQGVKVVRRRGRAIRLFTHGIAVDSHDYIVDLERRFDDWAESPEPPTAHLAVPFRASDPDPIVEALNPRVPADERAVAFQRIRDVPSLEDLMEAGAAFADPNVAREIERLKARQLRPTGRS